jgi:hypothetical protein
MNTDTEGRNPVLLRLALGHCTGAASPPLTLRPALGATGDLAALDLIASLSGQQTSDKKQLACVAQ